MSNDFPSSSNVTNRESLKKYYDTLLKEAEEENRKREDELQRELMSDDPLNVNYARWSTEEEFKKDLVEVSLDDCQVDQSGIPLLCSDTSAFVDASDSHSLIIGSSGSKKTRLFILPSILSLAKAGESMVVTDPKAELYERTSGYLRKKGYKVYCINFRDESVNNAWNPLEAPLKFFKQGKFDLSVGLLNDFATISIPKDSRGGADPFWDDSARSAFMGLLLVLFMLAEDDEEVNIRSLLRLRATLFNSKFNSESWLKKIVELAGVDSLVTTYLSGVSIAPERTFSSIIATLDTHLMKFVIRPSLTDMLCHNDIRFNDVGREKTAIFLVMPDEKETYHGLISVFIQQCYESLIFEAQKCEKKSLPVRVNFLLDEFSSLPQIKEFPSMIAAARSRNIRFNIVVQSEKQLKSRYDEEADTIKGNCNNWIYLYSREFPTLVEISNLCGTQKSGKPLITTSRLQRLDKNKGEVLVMHGRKYPFMSFLKDINEYDKEKIEKPYHEKNNFGKAIKLFDLYKLLSVMDEGYLRDRLKRQESTVASASVKYIPKFCANDLFARFIDQTDEIFEASRKWYKKHANSFSEKRTDLPREVSCEILESKDNTMYTREPITIRAIPNIVETVSDNIAIVGKDVRLLERISRKLYAHYIDSQRAIPLYFDLRKFDVPRVLREHEDEKACILPLLFAQQLFEVPVELEEDHLATNIQVPYDKLLNAFDREGKGSPEFVVILFGLDDAPFTAEAIIQSWLMGSRKNVRIVVVCTNEKHVLEENCAKFVDIKDENKRQYSHVILYFDEKTNEVCMKQHPSPTFRIQLIENE